MAIHRQATIRDRAAAWPCVVANRAQVARGEIAAGYQWAIHHGTAIGGQHPGQAHAGVHRQLSVQGYRGQIGDDQRCARGRVDAQPARGHDSVACVNSGGRVQRNCSFDAVLVAPRYLVALGRKSHHQCARVSCHRLAALARAVRIQNAARSISPHARAAIDGGVAHAKRVDLGDSCVSHWGCRAVDAYRELPPGHYDLLSLQRRGVRCIELAYATGHEVQTAGTITADVHGRHRRVHAKVHAACAQ